ncbi:MAG: hypothetical protein HOE45_09210, partial [Gammaproteobacteria bacterium]|nr:hypothetical protein [Gammaproteobacteria bacterium]
MSNRLLSKAALSAAILSIGIYSTAHAHSGGATLNPRGGNPSATALAAITC